MWLSPFEGEESEDYSGPSLSQGHAIREVFLLQSPALSLRAQLPLTVLSFPHPSLPSSQAVHPLPTPPTYVTMNEGD